MIPKAPMQPQAPPQYDPLSTGMQAQLMSYNMFQPLAPQNAGLLVKPNPFDMQQPGNPNLPYTDEINPWLSRATVSDAMWKSLYR